MSATEQRPPGQQSQTSPAGASSAAVAVEPAGQTEAVPPGAAPSTAGKLTRRRRPQIGAWLVERLIMFSGVLAIVIVLLIFVFLMKDGMNVFRHVSLKAFLLGQNWYPIGDPEEFGILPLILGSLYVTIGAILISVPLGIACAIYVAEVARPAVREVLKPTIEVLAGIPSVVVGFIGMVVLEAVVKKAFNLNTGLCGLTGSILLALMALPTIISISEDAIVAVPKEYSLGALALGATRWQSLRGVVVPAARSGIVAAMMLGIGRAIGETMTVLMVTGNAVNMPKSLLMPLRTMTATIAQEMGETVQHSSHYDALFGIGLALFLITFAINLVADIALHRGSGAQR